jgi:hypothetical protein
VKICVIGPRENGKGTGRPIFEFMTFPRSSRGDAGKR